MPRTGGPPHVQRHRDLKKCNSFKFQVTHFEASDLQADRGCASPDPCAGWLLLQVLRADSEHGASACCEPGTDRSKARKSPASESRGTGHDLHAHLTEDANRGQAPCQTRPCCLPGPPSAPPTALRSSQCQLSVCPSCTRNLGENGQIVTDNLIPRLA